MDSLSQVVLGSAVTLGVMGRRTAAWKAALWGGVAGTLPDLDVLIDHGDDLLNMVLHRAQSHSLLYLSLAAPVLAGVVSRVHGQTQQFGRWWFAMWMVLVTHPLLDAMTVYGTRWGLPFSDHPFAVGSVFIVDPAYTVPLLVGVVAALRMRDVGRGLRWNAVALGISCAYLAWSVVAQAQIERVARASLAAQGVAAGRLLVTPAPLQTLLWRVVALPEGAATDGFREAYVSVFDGAAPVRWTAHPRGVELLLRHATAEPVARLSAFAQGFVKASLAPDGRLWLTDLRMGQEPDYVFQFDLGTEDEVGRVPAVRHSGRSPGGPMLRWLAVRMWGLDAPETWRAAPPGLPD